MDASEKGQTGKDGNAGIGGNEATHGPILTEEWALIISGDFFPLKSNNSVCLQN